jgi:hypothetical protein
VAVKTVSKLLVGAAAVAAVTGGFAAPAAAQYYPGAGGYGNVVVGAVLDSILRGALGGGAGYGAPYGGYGRYGGGYNQQSERYLIDQCARATEQRLNGSSYGGGYNQYGSGYRVVQVDRLERTAKGNLRVHGAASTGGFQGNYGGYAGGYNQPYGGGYSQPYGGGYNAPYGGQYGGNYAQAPQLRFNCKIDNRGRITDLRVDRGQYGYNNGYRY